MLKKKTNQYQSETVLFMLGLNTWTQEKTTTLGEVCRPVEVVRITRLLVPGLVPLQKKPNWPLLNETKPRNQNYTQKSPFNAHHHKGLTSRSSNLSQSSPLIQVFRFEASSNVWVKPKVDYLNFIDGNFMNSLKGLLTNKEGACLGVMYPRNWAFCESTHDVKIKIQSDSFVPLHLSSGQLRSHAIHFFLSFD